MRPVHYLIFALLTGWTGQVTLADKATKDDDAKSTVAKLKGVVEVVFPEKGYSFTLDQVAKGVTFKYEISIGKDLPGVVPMPFPPSNREPAGASGMHPRESITGNGQSYCIEDEGLAPPYQGVERVLKKGKHQHKFEWDGRNWFGPSDFCNPKGKPFPAGTYDVSVELHGFLITKKGRVPYHITAKTKLVLKK